MNPSNHTPMTWVRRRPMVLAAAVVGAGIATGWIGLQARRRTAPATGGVLNVDLHTYRDIEWEDLIPKEWDPTKKLRQADGSLLSDVDPRARAMLDDLRAVWDNAPTVHSLDGAFVKLPGYVVPIDETDGNLSEFLLVPYFGACIHTPPPPANQIVDVQAKSAVRGFSAMDTVWVSGRMTTTRQDSPMGTSGYRLDAIAVQRYVAPASK